MIFVLPGALKKSRKSGAGGKEAATVNMLRRKTQKFKEIKFNVRHQIACSVRKGNEYKFNSENKTYAWRLGEEALNTHG